MAKGMFDISGDLSERDDAAEKAAFPRPIKGKSKPIHASKALPYRKPETAIDAKFGPGDKVC